MNGIQMRTIRYQADARLVEPFKIHQLFLLRLCSTTSPLPRDSNQAIPRLDLGLMDMNNLPCRVIFTSQVERDFLHSTLTSSRFCTNSMQGIERVIGATAQLGNFLVKKCVRQPDTIMAQSRIERGTPAYKALFFYQGQKYDIPLDVVMAQSRVERVSPAHMLHIFKQRYAVLSKGGVKSAVVVPGKSSRRGVEMRGDRGECREGVKCGSGGKEDPLPNVPKEYKYRTLPKTSRGKSGLLIACVLGVGPQRHSHPETDGGVGPGGPVSAPGSINAELTQIPRRGDHRRRPRRSMCGVYTCGASRHINPPFCSALLVDSMISTTPRPKQHSLPSTVGPSHHLAALAPLPPDSPPTPTATPTALRTSSTTAPTSPRAEDVSIWLRWALSPASALRVLLAPALLALPTRLLLLLLGPRVASSWVLRIPGWGQWDVPTNPFPAFFLLSHPSLPPSPASLSSPDSVLGLAMTPEWLHGGIGIGGDGTGGRQLYTKGPLDLLLLAWTVVLFSLLRLLFTNTVFPALARAAGIRRPGKVVRFGEQGYSVVYFAVVGVWGVYNMSTTPVGWFATRAFWEGYPHTHLGGAMKRYYLCQIGYWAQQSAAFTSRPRRLRLRAAWRGARMTLSADRGAQGLVLPVLALCYGLLSACARILFALSFVALPADGACACVGGKAAYWARTMRSFVRCGVHRIPSRAPSFVSSSHPSWRLHALRSFGDVRTRFIHLRPVFVVGGRGGVTPFCVRVWGSYAPIWALPFIHLRVLVLRRVCLYPSFVRVGVTDAAYSFRDRMLRFWLHPSRGFGVRAVEAFIPIAVGVSRAGSAFEGRVCEFTGVFLSLFVCRQKPNPVHLAIAFLFLLPWRPSPRNAMSPAVTLNVWLDVRFDVFVRFVRARDGVARGGVSLSTYGPIPSIFHSPPPYPSFAPSRRRFHRSHFFSLVPAGIEIAARGRVCVGVVGAARLGWKLRRAFCVVVGAMLGNAAGVRGAMERASTVGRLQREWCCECGVSCPPSWVVGWFAARSLVLILGLEKRRSDHWEMVVHHVVTMWMVSGDGRGVDARCRATAVSMLVLALRWGWVFAATGRNAGGGMLVKAGGVCLGVAVAQHACRCVRLELARTVDVDDPSLYHSALSCGALEARLVLPNERDPPRHGGLCEHGRAGYVALGAAIEAERTATADAHRSSLDALHFLRPFLACRRSLALPPKFGLGSRRLELRTPSVASWFLGFLALSSCLRRGWKDRWAASWPRSVRTLRARSMSALLSSSLLLSSWLGGFTADAWPRAPLFYFFVSACAPVDSARGLSAELPVNVLPSVIYPARRVPNTNTNALNPSTQFSKMLNYLQLEKPKVVSFAVFVVAWTYFRHYISIRILWSLQYEFHLVPKQHQLFSPRTGIYMALWMRDQMFYALILIRTVLNSETDDNRSDAEEEEENVNVNGAVEEKQPALGLAEPKEKGLGASLGRSDSENQNDTACPITPPRTPTPTRAKRGKKEKGAAARVANGGCCTTTTREQHQTQKGTQTGVDRGGGFKEAWPARSWPWTPGAACGDHRHRRQGWAMDRMQAAYLHAIPGSDRDARSSMIVSSRTLRRLQESNRRIQECGSPAGAKQEFAWAKPRTADTRDLPDAGREDLRCGRAVTRSSGELFGRGLDVRFRGIRAADTRDLPDAGQEDLRFRRLPLDRDCLPGRQILIWYSPLPRATYVRIPTANTRHLPDAGRENLCFGRDSGDYLLGRGRDIW
ncbi:hypothetical protein C8R46DRAFT_1049545 [Mycena filopes]|nr:hypothetical protein C8R46DRAFT_1049545 [Mycena filopes]